MKLYNKIKQPFLVGESKIEIKKKMKMMNIFLCHIFLTIKIHFPFLHKDEKQEKHKRKYYKKENK